MGARASKPAAPGTGPTASIRNSFSPWSTCGKGASPYEPKSSDFQETVAHILCCGNRKPKKHLMGQSDSSLTATGSKSYHVPNQQGFMRAVSENLTEIGQSNIPHIKPVMTGGPPVFLESTAPYTIPASTSVENSHQIEHTSSAMAACTDASSNNSAAVSAEVDFLLDNLLDAVAADATTALEAEVDVVVDAILDGLEVHIDKVMLDEVDVTVNDMLGCVIADVNSSIQAEVDCVVDDMLGGVVADVNNTIQVGVERVVDDMLDGVLKANEDAAAKEYAAADGRQPAADSFDMLDTKHSSAALLEEKVAGVPDNIAPQARDAAERDNSIYAAPPPCPALPHLEQQPSLPSQLPHTPSWMLPHSMPAHTSSSVQPHNPSGVPCDSPVQAAGVDSTAKGLTASGHPHLEQPILLHTPSGIACASIVPAVQVNSTTRDLTAPELGICDERLSTHSSCNNLPGMSASQSDWDLSAVSDSSSAQEVIGLSSRASCVPKVHTSVVEDSSSAFAAGQTAQHSSSSSNGTVLNMISSLADAKYVGAAEALAGSSLPSEQSSSAVTADPQHMDAEADGASAHVQPQLFSSNSLVVADQVANVAAVGGMSGQPDATLGANVADFEEINLWTAPQDALSPVALTTPVLSPVSDKIPQRFEQLPGHQVEQTPAVRSAEKMAAPMLQHQGRSQAASARQVALQRAHAARHLSSSSNSGDSTPPSRAASVTDKRPIPPQDTGEHEGSLRAWRCDRAGITAVKLDKKNSFQAQPRSQGSLQLKTPPADVAAIASGSASSADLHNSTSSPAAHRLKAMHHIAPLSGLSAKLGQAANTASSRMAVQYEAAKQVLQEQALSTDSLQQRGASLARTVSDRARPALADAASKTSAVGMSLAAKAGAVLQSMSDLSEAEQQLQTASPGPMTVRRALGDVFGLSQERVNGVAAVGARGLATWRSWGRRAD